MHATLLQSVFTRILWNKVPGSTLTEPPCPHRGEHSRHSPTFFPRTYAFCAGHGVCVAFLTCIDTANVVQISLRLLYPPLWGCGSSVAICRVIFFHGIPTDSVNTLKMAQNDYESRVSCCHHHSHNLRDWILKMQHKVEPKMHCKYTLKVALSGFLCNRNLRAAQDRGRSWAQGKSSGIWFSIFM